MLSGSIVLLSTVWGLGRDGEARFFRLSVLTESPAQDKVVYIISFNLTQL